MDTTVIDKLIEKEEQRKRELVQLVGKPDAEANNDIPY